jgi:hypothetical protein
MEIDFDGRTADGIIQASGEINLFSWGVPTFSANGGFHSVASNRNTGQLVWKPTFDLDLYLENIGAAALGQMVPDSAINATEGAMSGNIKIALDYDQVVDFSTNLSLSNMSWTINEESEANKGQNLTYAKKGLNNFRNMNKEIVVSSKGRISDPNFRVVPSLQTAITREAVSDAPKSVRRVASRDQLRFEDPELSPYAQNLAKTEQAIEQANEIATTMEKAQRLGNRLKNFIPFKTFPF